MMANRCCQAVKSSRCPPLSECNYLLATAYIMIIGVLAWLMLEFATNIVFRFNNANSVMF